MEVVDAACRVMDPPDARVRLVELLDDIQGVAAAFFLRQLELWLGESYSSEAPGARCRLDLDVALRLTVGIADEDVVPLVIGRHLLDAGAGFCKLGCQVRDDQVHACFAYGVAEMLRAAAFIFGGVCLAGVSRGTV